MIPIFFINMKRSSDRYTYIKDQLIKYPNKRIDAFDYNSTKKEDLIIDCKDIEYNKFTVCVASHLKAIKTAYDIGLDEVIISEDDINYDIFLSTYTNIFKYWNGCKDTTDILQLHSSSNKARLLYEDTIKTKKIKLLNKDINNLFYWGATFYIISKSGMNKIMSFYDVDKKKFNLNILKDYKILTDVILYIVCNCKIINIPCINITDPNKLKSTLQNKHHVDVLHYPTYNFINNNKSNFINILNDEIENKKIIHLTWKEKKIPLINIHNKLKELHQDWEIKLWTDDEMEQFINVNYPEYSNTYYNFSKMIMRCDFFRYLIVYHYGGFYLDLDIYMFRDLSDLLQRDLSLFCENVLSDTECTIFGHDAKEKIRVANYGFGAKPKNKFLYEVLEYLNNQNKFDGDVIETTGPGMLTRLYHRFKPCELIYPTEKRSPPHCNCKINSCRLGNYGNHLHMNSWRN